MRTSPEDYGIDDYLAVLRRRKWHILLPVVIIVMAGILILQILPPVYRATASITIEKPEVPSNLIEPTVVAGYVEERIAEVSRRVLTADTLLALAKRHQVYPEYSAESESGKIVYLMRNAVNSDTVNIEVNNPRGRTTISTIAMDLSFDAKDPMVAQKVANELARLYVTESERQAAAKAKKIASFMQNEATRLGTVVNNLERKLARFKSDHTEELPDAYERNRDRLEKIRDQLSQSNQRLQALKDQRISLEGALARTPKTILLSAAENEQLLLPEQRFANLCATYLQLSTRYASEYPDLVRIRSEIEMLGPQVPGGDQVVKSIAEFERLRTELYKLRQDRSASQDVDRLTHQIEQLKARIAAGNGALAKSSEMFSNNPDYLELKTRLDSVKGEINAVQSSNAQLQKRLESYSESLARTPEVEREYRALSRDYESALNKYRELRDKAAEARLAQQLEHERKGERFSLAQPAALPSTPVSPNQLGVLALSILFGFVGGFGSAAVAEYRSDAIYGAKDLFRTLGIHPLANIPKIDRQEHLRFRRTKIGFLLILSMILLAGVLVYLFGHGITSS